MFNPLPRAIFTFKGSAKPLEFSELSELKTARAQDFSAANSSGLPSHFFGLNREGEAPDRPRAKMPGNGFRAPADLAHFGCQKKGSGGY